MVIRLVYITFLRLLQQFFVQKKPPSKGGGVSYSSLNAFIRLDKAIIRPIKKKMQKIIRDVGVDTHARYIAKDIM